MHRFFIIQPCGAQMFEMAAFKVYHPGSNHPNCRRRTSQPALVIQRMIPVIPFHLRGDAIPVRQIHAGLKGDVPFRRRTHPGGMGESDPLETKISNRAIQSTFNLHQCLNGRHNRFRRLHIFSLTRIIIKFTGIYIMIPLSRNIQQFACIGQIES